MNTRDTLYTKDNNLYIGAFKATDLAKRFGTPLYVMDAAYISEVCDAFVAAMKSYGDGAVALPTRHLRRLPRQRLPTDTGCGSTPFREARSTSC